MDSDIRQALEKTLKRFKQGQWCKGVIQDSFGGYCLAGSILTELKGTPNKYHETFNTLGFKNEDAAIFFNDGVFTTRHDVIRVIEKALAKDIPDVVPAEWETQEEETRQLAKV